MNKERKPFTRGTYWLHVFTSYIISLFIISAFSRISSSEYVKVVYIFMTAYWILIEIRRFHDANKKAWPVLLNIIPGLGTMAALIWAGVLRPNYDNNKWYPHLKPRKKTRYYEEAEASDEDYEDAIDVDYKEVTDADYEEVTDTDVEEASDTDFEETADVEEAPVADSDGVIDVEYKEVTDANDDTVIDVEYKEVTDEE